MTVHSGLLVVHGTGTGKTLTASFVAKDFLATSRTALCILVSPPGVKGQFSRELATVLSRLSFSRVYTYGFDELANLVQSDKGKSLIQVVTRHPTLLIIDEAHYLNNEKSRRMASIFKLAMKVDKVLAMTATPITNKPSELGTLLAFTTQTPSLIGKDLSKVPDNQFRDMVACQVSMHRVDASNFDFPELVEHPPLQIPLTENAYYASIMDDVGFTTRIRYARERVKLMDLNMKLDYLLTILRKHPGKSIVYLEIKKNVATLQSFLARHGIQFDTIVGDTSPQNRPRIVQSFSVASPATRVMILSKAGAAGLDFKRVRNVIFMELPWNYSDYQQIVGRAVRYKSHPENVPRGRVNVFILMHTAPPGTRRPVFNQAVYNALQAKRQATAQLVSRVEELSIERHGACDVRNWRSASPDVSNTPNKSARTSKRMKRERPSPSPPVSRQTRDAVRATLSAWLMKVLQRPVPPKMAKNKNAKGGVGRSILKTRSMNFSKLGTPDVREGPPALARRSSPVVFWDSGTPKVKAKPRKRLAERVHAMVTRSSKKRAS